MNDTATCKTRPIAQIAAKRRVGALAVAALFVLATPVHAQVVPDNGLSMLEAVAHDFASAAALIDRQVAMTFSAGKIKYGFGLAELAALLAFALVLAWPLRLWLLARISAVLRTAPLEHRLALQTRALATVVLTTVLMALAGQVALAAARSNLALLPETAILARSLAIAIGVTGLGMGIGRALRSSEDKAWRPLPLPGGLGTAIGFYPFAAGLVLGLTNVIDQAARVLHVTETGWFLAQSLIVLVETLLIARFLIRAGQARTRALNPVVEPDGRPVAGGKKSPALPAIFGATALVWAALAVGLGAFVFGETRFGMLVLQELLWGALVLTGTWLITTFIDALMAQLFDEDWAVGRFATAVVGMRRARMKQIALLGSAVLTVLVWLFALGLVAAPLHGTHAAVMDQIRPEMLVDSLQTLKLSPRTVGAALAVLGIGIVLTRMLRGWLENSFLPTTSLDIGVRTSLVTGLSYLGILIAMVLATQMLGLQLEKITLIASALSVGIGFGLQSIIQNFVSGVILLIERPVKVGDWVVVSGAEGTIRKIRVRATELATAAGGTVIVPNSSFISSNVANRADSRMSERVDVTLNVAGMPTARQARDALRDLVAGCTLLRDDPAPVITLTTLGHQEWVFAIKVYAKSGTSVGQARSALLFWLSEQTEGKDLTITTPVPA